MHQKFKKYTILVLIALIIGCNKVPSPKVEVQQSSDNKIVKGLKLYKITSHFCCLLFEPYERKKVQGDWEEYLYIHKDSRIILQTGEQNKTENETYTTMYKGVLDQIPGDTKLLSRNNGKVAKIGYFVDKIDKDSDDMGFITYSFASDKYLYVTFSFPGNDQKEKVMQIWESIELCK